MAQVKNELAEQKRKNQEKLTQHQTTTTRLEGIQKEQSRKNNETLAALEEHKSRD